MRARDPEESASNAAVVDYIRSVRPSEESAEQVAEDKARIRAALEKQGIEVNEIRAIGSHSRGTAVEGSSDADYLVILPRDAIRRGDGIVNSNTVLKNVREALQAHLKRADSAKDGQAVVADFGERSADVVVGVYDSPAGPTNGNPAYAICDGDGGYMRTSPDAQNKFFREADERSGGRLKEIVRAVKDSRNRTQGGTRVKGAYIETVLAQAGVGTKIGQPTSQMLRDAYRAMHESGCKPIPDPTGVGDPIKACATPRQREHAQATYAALAERADRAVEAEERGNHNEARRLWSINQGVDL